jgi:hypothetical protein
LALSPVSRSSPGTNVLEAQASVKMMDALLEMAADLRGTAK